MKGTSPVAKGSRPRETLRRASTLRLGAFLGGLLSFGGLAFFASFERSVVAQTLIPEEILLFLFEDADGGGEVVVS